ASLRIFTKPKPLLRPVSRSWMTCALSTVPNSENNCSRSAPLIWKVSFPTYSFLPAMTLQHEVDDPAMILQVRDSRAGAGGHVDGKARGAGEKSPDGSTSEQSDRGKNLSSLILRPRPSRMSQVIHESYRRPVIKDIQTLSIEAEEDW